MANILETVDLFQKTLDELAVQTLRTGFMDGNGAGIIYTGGAEVKIPKHTTDGATNYDRQSGYALGNTNLEFQTRKFTQDRATKFHLDAMEVDESGFIVTASNTMARFQKDHMIPEIDAYRISKVAQAIIEANEPNHIKYGYKVDENIIKEIKKGITAIREANFDEELYIMATNETISAIEEVSLGKLQDVTFSQGGIDTRVPSIDGCPIIAMATNRMHTEIDTSGRGYKPTANSKNINFVIVAKSVPIAVTKQDVMRMFDPTTNQQANAWAIDYRRFHDLWVLDNQVKGIYLNIKDVDSSAKSKAQKE